MLKIIRKSETIGNDILFSQDDDEVDRPNPSLANNFIDVVSLDSIGGSKVDPSTGTYDIFYKDFPGGGFKSIANNGSLNATLTGATADATSGNRLGAFFAGNPYEILVVVDGVDVAGAYEVIIKQNRT